MFDRTARERDFKEGDLVLRWDSRREDNGKHGKFDKLWFGKEKIINSESVANPNATTLSQSLFFQIKVVCRLFKCHTSSYNPIVQFNHDWI